MCATQGYSLVALISKAVSHFILRYFHLLAPCFRCFAAFFFLHFYFGLQTIFVYYLLCAAAASAAGVSRKVVGQGGSLVR